MLGRGPLRNPFIFLESFLSDEDKISFNAMDTLEVIKKFQEYMEAYTDRERTILITLRKNIVWMAQGYPNVATFRNEIFTAKGMDDTMKITEDYFSSINGPKRIDHTKTFMAGGHG